MNPQPASERRSRFETLNEFVDHGQAHLRSLGCGAAAALWFSLWRFENAETGCVRVGAGTLGECFGTDKRNVQRMLAQLEEHGYLETIHAGSRGRGSCAVYRLFAVPEKASPAHILKFKKGVTNTPLATAEAGATEEEKASPVPLSPVEKGITGTPLCAPEKGVTVTPFEKEKASPEHGKGVTVTHVQKQKKNKDIPAIGIAGEESEAKRKKAPANPNHPLAVKAFCEAWQEAHGRGYCFRGKRDGEAVTFLLKAVDNDLAAFKAMVARYLADRDQFIVKNSHDLGIFRATVNKWTVPKGSSVARPVIKKPTDIPMLNPERLQQDCPPMEAINVPA